MSDDGRQTDPDLSRTIFEEGYLFEFFQLVRLLENWRGAGPRVGESGPYGDEELRLRTDSSLGFPPSDVRRVESLPDLLDPTERDKIGVTVSFMGLYGTAAPTPIYFTELINFTDVDADPLTDLLDIFNHRILALYYRSWLKYRFHLTYQPSMKEGDGFEADIGGLDSFSACVLSMAGLRELEARQMTHLPISRLTRYAGLLALRTRPAANLETLLREYFDELPVEIDEWALRWVPIPDEYLNRIGIVNSGLGDNLTIGEKVPDRSGKFRVRIGPVSYQRFREFLPGTEKHRQLCGLVHLWVGKRLDYDVEFVIRKEDIPECSFGTEVEGSQLGWTSWATSSPGLAEDPAVVFPQTNIELEWGGGR